LWFSELPYLHKRVALLWFGAVKKSDARFRLAQIASILSITLITLPSHAQQTAVPPQTLRNVAGIVAHRNGRIVPVGTAFFVAVPSQAVPGRAFVYLVTAHHNLLDADRKPATGLMLTLEDRTTGAMREQALPSETKWVLDPKTESADVAAVPFSAENANVAPIPYSSFMGAGFGSRTIAETGAQAYYLMAASVGTEQPRFEALARFGRVSVAVPSDSDVPGAGSQQLCFLDGGSTPAFSSGAPVFVQEGLNFVLWGILEASTGQSSNPMFAGLAGVLPSSYVGETVLAMASTQEKALHK